MLDEKEIPKVVETLTGLLINGLGELVDWWWNFQAFLQNSLVSLDANVFWPSHKTGQVAFWLHILSYKSTKRREQKLIKKIQHFQIEKKQNYRFRSSWDVFRTMDCSLF